MNKVNYREMQRVVQDLIWKMDYSPSKNVVVDIGSYDVNGSYKTLFPNWSYHGADIVAGPNVDLVMENPYTIPLPDNSADLIISGDCLQYVKNPFRLIQEAARILKSERYIIINASAEQRAGLVGLPDDMPNRPTDTFRYWPNGMHSILKEAGLYALQTYLKGSSCWGIATKL
jgi:SAM-dependent methyltransferase